MQRWCGRRDAAGKRVPADAQRVHNPDEMASGSSPSLPPILPPIRGSVIFSQVPRFGAVSIGVG